MQKIAELAQVNAQPFLGPQKSDTENKRNDEKSEILCLPRSHSHVYRFSASRSAPLPSSPLSFSSRLLYFSLFSGEEGAGARAIFRL